MVPPPIERNSRPHSRPASSIVEYGDKLAALSARERMVVDLAAKGRTDEQIAQALELSVSTINSYWVRIRGKLGPYARVEIVAELIRHQARLQHAELRAENLRLLAELERTTAQYEELRAIQASRGDTWHLAALHHSPEATLVANPSAEVVFANRAAWRLYHAQPGELEGLAMQELTVVPTSEALREPCRRLFETEEMERETIGVEDPYFARRRDGSNFRAVLQAQRFATPTGPLAVVSVREFLGEADAIFQALRQPLKIA